MNTSVQLKALIRNMAVKTKVNPQSIMANYMMERLLERISLSRYQSNFILKGGLLIASIVGLESRATVDMDTTIKGYPLTGEHLKEMINEIVSIHVEDSISFVLKSVAPIREDAEYSGMRVSLEAHFDNMRIPLKIDVTTGDAVTPRAISYQYPLMFEERKLNVLAYNLETVLAEKLETILSRSIANTRMRDFYDVYILTKLHGVRIDMALLSTALLATAKNRASTAALESASNTLDSIVSSVEMKKLWEDYGLSYSYAREITWDDACRAVCSLYDNVEESK